MTRRVYNFIRGAGSILELLPPPVIHKISGGALEVDDEELLRRDWQIVGEDLSAAIQSHANGQTKSAESGLVPTGRER